MRRSAFLPARFRRGGTTEQIEAHHRRHRREIDEWYKNEAPTGLKGPAEPPANWTERRTPFGPDYDSTELGEDEIRLRSESGYASENVRLSSNNRTSGRIRGEIDSDLAWERPSAWEADEWYENDAEAEADEAILNEEIGLNEYTPDPFMRPECGVDLDDGRATWEIHLGLPEDSYVESELAHRPEPSPEAPPIQTCSHCGAQVTTLRRGLCNACYGYHNRYRRLPDGKTLRKRTWRKYPVVRKDLTGL